MKRIVRLTESDLTRIVRRVISEQFITLPDGTYYGASIGDNGDEYALYEDKECKKPTGYKVIKAPLWIRDEIYASLTTVTNGVPNSEDWLEGGQIVPVGQ